MDAWVCAARRACVMDAHTHAHTVHTTLAQ